MTSVTDGLVCVQFRLISAIFIVLHVIYNYFASFFYSGDSRQQRVPRTENEIFRKSSKQLAHDIRRKKISAQSVVSAFIDRQREVNPIINAVVDERYEDALREAHEVDAFLQNTPLSEAELADRKPLLGVPVTIKESLSLKGMKLVVGAKDRLGMKAEDHGGSVQLLVDAGAIPLCVTTTPELCLSTETRNLITGTTNNPYNILYTPGGSSGGEGAMISSAGSVIGLGSDIAGSIRIPAAFCGIFGHKPTTGAVSLKGHIPYTEHPLYHKHLSIGPLCRYAEDLLYITKIITGNNPALHLDDPVKLANLRMYYMVDSGSCFGSMPVHKKIKQRIRDSVDYFSRQFDCEVSDCKFEEMQYIGEANAALFLSIKPDDEDEDHPSLLSLLMKSFMGKPEYSAARLFYLLLKADKFFMPSDVERSKKLVEYLERKIDKELGDNGVFFYPIFPTSAFRHGKSFFVASAVSYPAMSNVLGLPATSVPVGFIENGMPIGIQVVAARNQDRLCLAVAKELEAYFGGWMPPF